MQNSLKLIRQLPFAYPFKTTNMGLLPVKTAILNLGNTFYIRLVQIHQNLVEALIQNNISYLKQALIPELSEELTQIRQKYKDNGFKLKIHQPLKKIKKTTNLLLPETVFKTQNFKISLACKAYFGGNILNLRNVNEKVIRFGEHRYIIYNSQLSFMENVRRIYTQQFYEFIVKYQSNIYIKMRELESGTNLYEQARQNKKYSQNEQDEQDLIATQIVMRSSSDKFDWIIIDINNLMKDRGIRM